MSSLSVSFLLNFHSLLIQQLLSTHSISAGIKLPGSYSGSITKLCDLEQMTSLLSLNYCSNKIEIIVHMSWGCGED